MNSMTNDFQSGPQSSALNAATVVAAATATATATATARVVALQERQESMSAQNNMHFQQVNILFSNI